jgi:protein ImuA
MVEELREQVRRIEGARRRSEAEDGEAVVSSGAPPLDRLLPEGGLLRGSLVEWLVEGEGRGAGMLALIAAREAALEGGAVVVMDRGKSFYPPAAAALGIDLEKLIVVRAGHEKDELWALEQSLACRGVAAVWAPLARLDWRSFRRLQLAAESSGALGLLLRPNQVRGQPSWAHLQLCVGQPLPVESSRGGDRTSNVERRTSNLERNDEGRTKEEDGGPRGRRLRVEITRGRTTGPVAVELEIDEVTSRVRELSRDETPALPLASRLADPAPRRRPARA